MYTRVTAVIVAMLAAGCAGSDSGPDMATAPEPPLESAYRTLATYNSVVTTSFHTEGIAEGVVALCSSRDCITDETLPELPFTGQVEGPYTARMLGEATWTPQGETGGIEIWELDPASYGGWLDHSFFLIARTAFGDRNMLVGQMFGRLYDGTPLPVEGTASYAGAMVGTDVLSAANYRGDARLEVDFADASLDATFSGIEDIDTGQSLDDVTYDDMFLIPESYAAVGGVPRTGDYINARFYGPDHEELTGVFGKGTLIGAFGTRRQ